MQGIVFDKFVELDMDEVLLRKVHAISSKAGLRDVLQRDNDAQLDVGKGRVTSAQYHAQPADLRDVSQVRAQRSFASFSSCFPTEAARYVARGDVHSKACQRANDAVESRTLAAMCAA